MLKLDCSFNKATQLHRHLPKEAVGITCSNLDHYTFALESDPVSIKVDELVVPEAAKCLIGILGIYSLH